MSVYFFFFFFFLLRITHSARRLLVRAIRYEKVWARAALCSRMGVPLFLGWLLTTYHHDPGEQRQKQFILQSKKSPKSV
jgi:hypothetical protein